MYFIILKKKQQQALHNSLYAKHSQKLLLVKRELHEL